MASPLDQPGFQQEFTLGVSNKEALIRKERLASRVGMGGNAEGRRQKQWQALPPGLGWGVWVGRGRKSVTQPRRAGAGERSQQQGCGHQGDAASPSSRPHPVGASRWKPEARAPGEARSVPGTRAERSTDRELPAHIPAPHMLPLASGPLHLPVPCLAHPSALSTRLTRFQSYFLLLFSTPPLYSPHSVVTLPPLCIEFFQGCRSFKSLRAQQMAMSRAGQR